MLNPNPTSLADYERALTDTLADTELDTDARSAQLSMLATAVRDAVWRDRDAGRELAARIEQHVDHQADRLRGLHTLVKLGRATARTA